MPLLLLLADDAAGHGDGHAAVEHAEVLDMANWLPGVTTLIVGCGTAWLVTNTVGTVVEETP